MSWTVQSSDPQPAGAERAKGKDEGSLRSERSRPRLLWPDRVAGPPGVLLALLWGFAEGTLFFVVPDVVISLAAILRPRSAWKHVAAAIIGAAIGGAVLFNWSVRDPQAARSAVAHVPFIKAAMLVEVHRGYQAHGMGALFLGPLFGTPYKIYAIEAPEFVRESPFLMATAPARGERFLLVWAAFAVAGAWLRKYRKRSCRQLAIGCIVCWIVFYSMYWCMILYRYR